MNDIPLTVEEVVHIATILGAYWQYDYAAAQKGRLGLHALLKSGWHSEGFIDMKILLQHENIMEIIAHQIVLQIRSLGLTTPDRIVGVPNGATELATRIAKMLGTRSVRMEKVGGRMILDTEIPDGTSVLCVEDVCTRATGYKEAIREIANKYPFANFVPYAPVIFNRGELEIIYVA